MEERIKDRRIRRTHRLLKQGLAELMQEKDFKDITVRDITDRMDLNRGTFYLHYTDTYDLLQKLEQDTLDDVQEMIDNHSSEMDFDMLLPVFEPILNYIVENRDICKSLFVSNASSDFIDKVHELIHRNGIHLIQDKYPQIPEDAFEYLVSFITYGLIGLIKQWFDTNMRMRKGDILHLADGMVTSAASRIFSMYINKK